MLSRVKKAIVLAGYFTNSYWFCLTGLSCLSVKTYLSITSGLMGKAIQNYPSSPSNLVEFVNLTHSIVWNCCYIWLIDFNCMCVNKRVMYQLDRHYTVSGYYRVWIVAVEHVWDYVIGLSMRCQKKLVHVHEGCNV